MTTPPFWQLVGFAARLEIWAADQAPDAELANTVTRWVFTRFDDPYQGVHRESSLPNYWWGALPGTDRHGAVVCCFYWIYEMDRLVRCDSFATLSRPL